MEALLPHRLIEKQVIFDGKKVRLEVHHFEDEQGKRLRRENVVGVPSETEADAEKTLDPKGGPRRQAGKVRMNVTHAKRLKT